MDVLVCPGDFPRLNEGVLPIVECRVVSGTVSELSAKQLTTPLDLLYPPMPGNSRQPIKARGQGFGAWVQTLRRYVLDCGKKKFIQRFDLASLSSHCLVNRRTLLCLREGSFMGMTFSL